MGFLDRRPFDAADPDGQELLRALLALYDRAQAVRHLVLAAGMQPADFAWTEPMSLCWPEVLSKAAGRKLLRRLVAIVAENPDSAAHEVIARLLAEPAGEAAARNPAAKEPADGTPAGDAEDISRTSAADPGLPPPDEHPAQPGLPGPPASADDLRGLADDQVHVLRCCAIALTSLLAAADAAEATSRLSPEFADVSVTMQFELSRTKRGLTALRRSVGLATWPDTDLAARLIAARSTAQRDVEAAQGHPGVPEGTTQDRQRLRQSAAALRTLLQEHYPSLFTPLP
jgi:hypothetical protein